MTNMNVALALVWCSIPASADWIFMELKMETKKDISAR